MKVAGPGGLLIVGTIVALLLAEALVRVGGVAPEVGHVAKWRWRLSSNPKIGYELIPNAKPQGARPLGESSLSETSAYETSLAERPLPGHRGRANDLGFRDYDHRVEKAVGTQRAIVLGDSITWGYRVPGDEDVFPSVVERKLIEAGRQAEVMNFGVGGYNTQQEVETLKDKGLVYDPDLVVLAYCLNDEKNADGGVYTQLLAAEQGAKHFNAARMNPVLRGSALVRFLYYRVFARDAAPEGADRSIFENHVERYFAELRQIALREGFEVLVVVFPNFGGLDTERSYRFQEIHDRVRGYAAANGFEHLDLLPSFLDCQRANPDERLAFDSYHPTAAGHRCAGEAIANVLLETFWGPGSH